MAQTDRGAHAHLWIDDGTGRSEEEIALRQGAAMLGAMLGAGLVLLLRAVDAVLEAWPLPTSRPRK